MRGDGWEHVDSEGGRGPWMEYMDREEDGVHGWSTWTEGRTGSMDEACGQ